MKVRCRFMQNLKKKRYQAKVTFNGYKTVQGLYCSVHPAAHTWWSSLLHAVQHGNSCRSKCHGANYLPLHLWTVTNNQVTGANYLPLHLWTVTNKQVAGGNFLPLQLWTVTNKQVAGGN